jgi:hypothetical protein
VGKERGRRRREEVHSMEGRVREVGSLGGEERGGRLMEGWS